MSIYDWLKIAILIVGMLIALWYVTRKMTHRLIEEEESFLEVTKTVGEEVVEEVLEIAPELTELVEKGEEIL